MATIKPIEHKSVHHIQSGQVIGDGLISVVKELVENSLDADATSVEVRFKNYGLDAVEVIDNGSGITPDNYESIALKHWTSKLTTYSDLDNVTTFGFRGEALSSLCALSDLQITTATADEAPKGTRLEFGTSGKVKSRSVAAAQRGTAVLVENIFKTLPVRRKELERNIKREYTKVLGILQAYAGVCVGVKFSVFNQPAKGRRTPVFATKGNKTTKENITNVFGAKTLSALVALDLQFEMKPTRKDVRAPRESENKEIKILGHISRPIVGEGRQTPDRQMFFVNGRPCVLPQIARAFNEVYKTFNVTQSPFIFADMQMDTNAYDVNVSPDKRSILLHDQTELLESLKVSLITMFTNHEQTVPNSRLGAQGKLPSYKQLTLNHASSATSSSVSLTKDSGPVQTDSDVDTDVTPQTSQRGKPEPPTDNPPQPANRDKAPSTYIMAPSAKLQGSKFKPPTVVDLAHNTEPVISFTARTIADEITDTILEEGSEDNEDIALPPPASPARHEFREPPPSAMTSPFSKLSYRSPRRPQEGEATITIGDREPVTAGGSSPLGSPSKRRKIMTTEKKRRIRQPKFGTDVLSRFAAPGTQVEKTQEVDIDYIEELDGMEEEEGVDEMTLDYEVVNEGSEIFREASQVEMVDGFDAEKDTTVEADPVVLDYENTNSLFLPNAELDAMLSDGEVTDEVMAPDAEEEKIEEPLNAQREKEVGEPFNAQGEDGDFTDPSENLNQSSLRAQKLLLEAEAAVSAPTSKGLERAFRILEGSRTNSTKNLVRICNTSISKLRQQAKTISESTESYIQNTLSPSNSTLIEDDVSAEEHLNLTITKQDFFSMQIKGQFNRGFILTTRADDFFIIDQHASDEKYNFETLQHDTIVQHQRLAVPKTLELMAMDEVVVTEHLDVFRKNGFVIEVDADAPTGARCKLVTLPLSGTTVFSIKDLEELIHLVHENQGNNAVRCSKVRSMFAMRACKKSTKVGKALTVSGMERIVRHMGELDKPWNCPHGRPTMRHLMELGKVAGWREYDEQEEWGRLQWDGQNWENVRVAMVES